MPFRKEDIFAPNFAKNEFLENIKQYSEDEKKETYIELSSLIRDSISSGILKDVQHLYSFIEHINKSSVFCNIIDEKTAKASKNACIIILTCKCNKLNILKWVFSDEKIMKTFAFFMGKKSILPTDEDDLSHDAFYYAVRSNNTELLDVIINKWPSKYVVLSSTDLEFLLSSAFETLKLNNISISHKMEYVVGEQLLNLRFAPSTSGSVHISIKNILKRIDLVIESFEILKSEYSERKDTDEKFLYIAKFIAENIHTLKRQLRSTYETLPWEEIEFCLIIFISSCIKKKEFNIYCKCVLNKTRILRHLENFFSALTNEKENIKLANINQLGKLPNQNRSTVVGTIIKANYLFEGLYKDYKVIRDIHSLEKIDDCLTITTQIDCSKNEGQMLVMRALQITGEHLKNTLESPKLSTVTSDFLISLLPQNTKKILQNLRNSLSHAGSINPSDVDNVEGYFKSIQNDLRLLKDVILDLTCKEKFKLIVRVLEKLVSSESSEKISEIIDIFTGVEYEDLKVPKGSNVREEIESFSNKVSSQLEVSEYEKRHLLDLRDIISKDGSKLDTSSSNYSFAFISLLSFCKIAYLRDLSDLNIIKNAKYLAGCVLNVISNIEVKTKKEILDILYEIYSCLKFRKHEENSDKILVDWHRLVINIQSDVSELRGIHELFLKFNCTKNSTETKNILQSNNKDQLEIRLCLLKEFLTEKKLLNKTVTDEEISLYMSKIEWQLITEMLLLDLFSALQAAEVKLASNVNFFDNYTPILNGKWLRNHLAHFNNIVEIEHFNSSIAILLNAKKIVNHEWNKKNMIFRKTVNTNISLLKSKFYTGLSKLDKKIDMFEACEKGNLEKVIMILEKGADIYSKNFKNVSALHYASKSSNLSLVKYVFENVFDSEHKDINGNTPLHVAAAACGSSNIVNYFITNKIFDANEGNKALDTALHVASLSGCRDNIKILLKYVKDIYLKNMVGLAAIHLASIKNQVEIVELLLKNKVNINSVSKGGLTPLHIAAEDGHVKLVKFLIEKGAEVNAKKYDGGIPLHNSALDGHVEVVKLLLANGSKINEQVSDGYTALQNAVESGHEEIVKILLEKGANANLAKVANNYVPLHRAASDGNVNITTLLLENGAHVNFSTSEGFTPLHFASLSGHLHVVKLLVKFGAHVNSKTRTNVSALQLSVSENHTEVVTYLIDKGAIINCMDATGFSPLHCSIQKGNIKLINLLIKNGAYINAKTYSGITPLHLSLQHGLKSVFKTLTSHNVDIYCVCNNGRNCLHFAATFDGNSDIIENLISLGFQINSKDNQNNTALHIASMCGNCQMVKELLKHNAYVDSKQLDGVTPLHMAIDRNHQKVVEILVNSGSNVNIKSGKFYSLSSLSLAIKNKNFDIVKLLLNKGFDINSDDGKSLYFAVGTGNKEVVDILINNSVIDSKCLNKALTMAVLKDYNNIVEALILKGANVNKLSTDVGYCAPLHLASKFGFNDLTKTLIDHGAEVDIKTPEGGNTPLQIAIRHDHFEVVKTLIVSGKANILTKDYANRTAIEFAVAHGHFKIVKLLLPNVIAHINDKGNSGFTLLHIAAQTGNSRVTEFLINSGADINATNTLGSKPFHIAAREGNVQDLELFIKNGNSLNDVGAAGFNLAHYAAVEGHIEVLKFLISKNIDLNAVDLRGWRPLNYSAERGFKEFTELLIENGAFYNVFNEVEIEPITNPINNQVMQLLKTTENLLNAVKLNDSKKVGKYIREGAFINGKTRNGNTALSYSSWKGFHDIVNILLQHNANPNIISKGDCSPLHYASKFGRDNIVLALLSHGAIYDLQSLNGKLPLDFASDKKIISILKLIADVFRMIEKHDIEVLRRLASIKNDDLMNAVFGCQNKDKQFLLVVAIVVEFPKLNDLQNIFCSKESFEISCAEVLILQEKYIEAMNIYKSIVIKREKTWGANNPITLQSKNDVAGMYYKSGNYFEALKVFENVYQKQSQIFGLNNKVSLRTRSLIAHVLNRMGKVDKALEIFREVYAAQTEICGENDSDTLVTRFHMALSLNDLRKFDEALMHNFEVYKIRKSIHGPNHQYTLNSYNNYAMVLVNKREYKEAFRIFKEVYEAKKKIFGASHSETLRTAQLIAATLPNIQDDGEGLKLSEYTYKLQTEKLGQNHPETLNTKYNIGNYHLANGNRIEAFKIFSELLPKRKEIFGINHESVKDIESKLKILKKTNQYVGFDTSNIVQNFFNIHSAANEGNLPTLENLLKNGCDVNERDSESRTALHFSVNMGHEIAVNTLLNYGADPTVTTKKGNTTLHTAVIKNNKEIAEILLTNTRKVYPQKFYDFINAKTHSSCTTALHIAVKSGSEELVKLLLSYGAIYSLKDASGKSPEQYSQCKLVSNMLNLTKEAFESANSGSKSILKKLKREKKETVFAILNARNDQKQTAIQIALLQQKNLGKEYVNALS